MLVYELFRTNYMQLMQETTKLKDERFKEEMELIITDSTIIS